MKSPFYHGFPIKFPISSGFPMFQPTNQQVYGLKCLSSAHNMIQRRPRRRCGHFLRSCHENAQEPGPVSGRNQSVVLSNRLFLRAKTIDGWGQSTHFVWQNQPFWRYNHLEYVCGKNTKTDQFVCLGYPKIGCKSMVYIPYSDNISELQTSCSVWMQPQ